MKKRFIIYLLITFLVVPMRVFAAGSASLSVASSVEVGSKVTATVTLKNTAAWDIQISSSGSTSGCSQHFTDVTSNGNNTTKTLSVTCKATSTGTIGFTVSGAITDSNGNKSNVSLSKRVTVTEPRPKATDANLASLTVEGYDLTPTFNKDTLEYLVTVPSTINNITIAGTPAESHATVEGTGGFEVSEGINTFNIVVTAENGTQKTYKINVNVEDTNPINIKIGNKNYSLIKNPKNLTQPNFYEAKTIMIENTEIPAFYSDTTKFTLVGIKDAEGNVFLAIYDETTNEYTIYNETKATTLSLYLTDFPNAIKEYTKTTITINDIEIPAYKKEEKSRFAIVYGVNLETGKYDYYKYDTEENTFQIWDKEEVDALKEDVQTYIYACYAFGGGLFVSFLLIISLLHDKKKRKKKNKKIDKLEKKEEAKKQEEKIDDFWREEKKRHKIEKKEEPIKKPEQEKKSIEEAIENWEDKPSENEQPIKPEEPKLSSNEELFGINNTKENN